MIFGNHRNRSSKYPYGVCFSKILNEAVGANGGEMQALLQDACVLSTGKKRGVFCVPWAI
jgi:hypothetical protein